MTTAPISITETTVLDYLSALWAQSEDLTPELREELMTTVTDYVAARRAAGECAEEVLLRLGPPEALVAAVRLGQRPTPTPLAPASWPPAPSLRVPIAAQRTGAGAVEYTGIGLLGAGAFVVPGLAPVAGLLLITGSPRWTPAQKAGAWLLTVASGAGAFALMLVLATFSIMHASAVLMLYLAVCAGPALASVLLFTALRDNEAR